MSFILDALKKIEQDKRRPDDARAESIAISGSRLSARQPVVAMIAVAVGSALLTAAAVSFLSGGRQVEHQPPPAINDAVVPPPHADSTSEVEAEPPAREPPPTALDASTNAADVAPEREREPEPEREREREREPEREPEPDSEPELAPPRVTEETSTGDAEPTSDEGPQPIRIVGKERVLLDALNIDGVSDSLDDEAPASEVDTSPPEGFPDLVLQGTSVIGANAVAVISDQRVFEGDRIEGALVVRIGEREVELELDGRRFVLRL